MSTFDRKRRPPQIQPPVPQHPPRRPARTLAPGRLPPSFDFARISIHPPPLQAKESPEKAAVSAQDAGAEREASAKERNTLRTRLFNMEALYERYLAYLSRQKGNTWLSALGAHVPMALGTSLGTQPDLHAMRAELDADLAKAGLPGGVSDFAKLISDYETVFEKETLAVAKGMLDQYEQLLAAQEQRYLHSADTDALFDQVHQTQARADFEEAEKIRSEHATGVVLTLGEMADQSFWAGKRNEALARGQQKLGTLTGEHPLINARDFPHEGLARSSKEEVPSLVRGFIAERKKDIADTRKSLADKPRMIYGLDTLIETSFRAQSIQPGSLYEKIIRNHISDVHWDEAIPDVVLAVIAGAAGLLTGGTGTVAVLAGGAAFGIGAYQALEEFRRYELKSAASGAGLTSDDPSMAWVIVAVIAAGIDAGAFARALPKLRGPLQAFNAGTEAGDVAALSQKLSGVEEDIRRAILKAADAELEARAAWKNVTRPAGIYSFAVPHADTFGRFVYAVYLSAMRGIRELQLFVKSREALELLGDISKLPAEELAALKVGYLQALEEVEAIAAHGKALGMADNEILAFMNLRGNTKGMTAEQVVKEMGAWKARKSSGIPFGFDTVEQFEDFKAAAIKGLKKTRYHDAEAILQGSAASGISYKKKIPFGAHSDVDVAVAGRSVFERARKLGYTVDRNPMRIGPLSDKQIKELELGSMYGALTDAADGREVNVMLFSTRESALQGIAGVKPESIPFK